MTNEKSYASNKVYSLTTTVASGQILSSAIDLHGMDLAGVFIPSNFDGTKIYIQASSSLGGSYNRIQVDGVDFSLSATAGKPVAISNLAITAAWQFIKLEADTVQSTDDTILTLALRLV
ncbi:MAG: hypothetical protein R3D71_01310 [Rickettsiales bacterium]